MSDQDNIPSEDEQVKYLRTIDIPATARQILYGSASVGSLVLAYLGAESLLDGPSLAMGFGAISLVFGLATGKTDTRRKVEPKPMPVEQSNDQKPAE